ncbi:MAG: triphosphoribosyl-dephospho-CoA synthase [Candidatus Bathyarchaeales archaeon]
MPQPLTTQTEIIEHIAACAQLAILLEVNAPKPGNIHKNANFHKTNYEHFLASAVAIAPSLKTAAAKGIQLAEEKIHPNQTSIGNIIKDATKRINHWQHGGNTLLGTTILLTPIAIAAGKTLKQNNGKLDLEKLRKNIKTITTTTTPEDAVAVYEAIEIAKPGGLNKTTKFDATNPLSKKEILKTHTTLYDIFKISAKYDSIANEWINNYHVTFNIGYKTLQKELETKNNINHAIIQTFLQIISQIPDTLIARKNGTEKAKKISQQAKHVLELGGLNTEQGKKAIAKLDYTLRDNKNKLNPGTTADLITATLTLHILKGYRP